MLGKGRVPAKPIKIGEVRELTQGELVALHVPRGKPSAVQKFRDSHRKMAWLFAIGMKTEQVALTCGYSLSRVYSMYPTPAFQELIAVLREKVDNNRAEVLDEFQEDVNSYKKLVFEGMVKAQRQLVDRLDDADEEEQPLAPRELISISHGSHELLYGKKQTNVNVNIDFAAKLDRAVARSSKVKVIEHQPDMADPSARTCTGRSSSAAPAGPPQALQGPSRSAASLQGETAQPIRRRVMA